MNYYEEQIQNFEQNSIGVPPYLASMALAERFCDGWDAGEIEKLSPAEIKKTADWSDLRESVAWAYRPEDETILSSIANLKN